ncbi:MAG: hypothetical protein JWR19_2193 [Pedosphaera sp.]|nr:hypothetical protein [Pedosphaera sp.]
MKMEQIDAKVMRQIQILESELQCFHAYRHLWADDVACGHKTELTRPTLEDQQLQGLHNALGAAKGLATHLGIKWCNEITLKRVYRENLVHGKDYLIHLNDGPFAIGTFHAGGCYLTCEFDTYDAATSIIISEIYEVPGQ